MKEVSAQELRAMRDRGEKFTLIDVREPYETEQCTIGGTPIPMSQLMDRLAEIPNDMPVVVHCNSGKRSCAVTDTLNRYGFRNIINLRGGIQAWHDEVDRTLNCGD